MYTKVLNKLIPARIMTDDDYFPEPPKTEIVVDMLWNHRPNLDGGWGVYSTTKITDYPNNDTLVKLVNKTFDSSRFYYKIDNPEEYYPVNAYRADNYVDAYRILEDCTANNLTKMYLNNDNCTLKDVPLTEWLQYNPANEHYVMCGAFTKEWGNISGCETAVLVLPNGDKVDGYLPTGGGGSWTIGPDFYSLAFAPKVYMSGSVGRREYFTNYRFFYDADGYFKIKNTLTNKTYKIAKDEAGSTLLTISNTYNGVVGQRNRGPVVSSVLTNKVDGKRAFYLFEEV